MRKYRAQPTPRRTGGLLCLACLLLKVLSICPFVLAPTALASSSRAIAGSPPAQDITRAGVSVVRLVVEYAKATQQQGGGNSTKLAAAGTNSEPYSSRAGGPGPTPPSSVACTGLGVLVEDWSTTNTSEKNVWVLTDSALLSTSSTVACAGSATGLSLASVTLFLSNAYNATQMQSFQLTPSKLSIYKDCLEPTDPSRYCTSTAVFLSFNSTASNGQLPYLDVFTNEQAQQTGIALSNSKSIQATPGVNADVQTAQGYLIPSAVAFTASNSSLEAGTPVVNAAGELTGMHLQAGDLTALELRHFFSLFGSTVAQQRAKSPANIVHDQWDAGLMALYKQPPDYKGAQTAFQAAFQANSEFQGAHTLAQSLAPPTPTPIRSPSGGGSAISQSTTNVPLLILIVVGIIIYFFCIISISDTLRRKSLSLLVKVSTMLFGKLQWLWTPMKRRTRNQRLKEDMAEAERRSRVDVQRLAIMQPQAPSQQQLPPKLVLPPVEPQPKLVLPPADPKFAPSKRFCPRCGTQLPGNATRCAVCQLVLPVAAAPSSGVAPSPVVERAQSEVSVVIHTPEPVREVSLPPPQQPPATPPVVEEESRVQRQEEVMRLPEEELQITERVGTRLGNYKLLGLLGSGGFAEVYLGEHRYLKTKAAIKVLHKRLDIESLIGFLKEARTIANLVHPQIIRVLEFGVEGSDIDLEELEQSSSSLKRGAPFLIMDYAPGGTLRRRHPKGTRVPLTNVLTYVSHLAEALDYAHQHRIIHRDIKPENMLLRQRDEVLLSDFGIAVAAHGEQSLNTQDMAGTYPYMAPEQIRGKPRPASDQYSLAIVVYEWLCGTRPFQGSQWELIEQHLSTTPASLCAKVPSLPKNVEQVVMRALSKEPSQRYENMKAFARALADASR